MSAPGAWGAVGEGWAGASWGVVVDVYNMSSAAAAFCTAAFLVKVMLGAAGINTFDVGFCKGAETAAIAARCSGHCMVRSRAREGCHLCRRQGSAHGL